jgi:hypothetical protein
METPKYFNTSVFLFSIYRINPKKMHILPMEQKNQESAPEGAAAAGKKNQPSGSIPVSPMPQNSRFPLETLREKFRFVRSRSEFFLPFFVMPQTR